MKEKCGHGRWLLLYRRFTRTGKARLLGRATGSGEEKGRYHWQLLCSSLFDGGWKMRSDKASTFGWRAPLSLAHSRAKPTTSRVSSSRPSLNLYYFYASCQDPVMRDSVEYQGGGESVSRYATWMRRIEGQKAGGRTRVGSEPADAAEVNRWLQ